MKKSVLFAVALAAVTMALLLVYPAAAISGGSAALELWWNAALPSLLPFFVLCRTISPFLPSFAGSRPLPLLGLPKSWLSAVALGMLSGYPMGARLANDLCQDKKDPRLPVLLLLCNLAGPMFMVGTVATAMLGAPFLGPIMLVSHYAANGVCAALMALLTKKSPPTPAKNERQPRPAFVSAFAEALTQSMPAMLRIGACMVFFCALFSLLTAAGLLRPLYGALYQLFGVAEPVSRAFVQGLFEMTSGCSHMAATALPLSQKAALCCFLVTFGGGSIILQTLSFCKAPLGPYVLGKLGAGVLSSFLCLALCAVVPVPIVSMAQNTITPWQFSLTASSILLAVFFIASRKKS